MERGVSETTRPLLRVLSRAALTPTRSLSADNVFHALNAPEEMAQMGRASPRHLSSGSWRAIRPTSTQIRQLATAFTAGALLAFLLTSWSARSGFPSLHTQPHPGLSVCDMPKAQGIALSPLALANMTGSATFIPDKLIVAARHHEDTSWLDTYLSHIPHIVYQVDEAEFTIGAQHATKANKGNEASAYLQFIIDYYTRLPKTIAFVHGHRSAWHLRDHVPILQRLRWGEIGFANLRFQQTATYDLQFECQIESYRAGNLGVFDCSWVGNYIRPGGYQLRAAEDIWTGNKDEWWDSVELEQAWNQTYLKELGPPPPELHAPCCAEFVVDSARILAHPRSFYISLRDWIVRTELDRYRSGRVFEYMWHYIFGEAPIIDPIPMCQLMHCPANATAPAAKPMAPSPKPKSAEYSTRQFTGRGIRRQPLRDMGIGSSTKA